MRSGNGRRLYTSLCKIKIIIVKPTMRGNARAVSLLIFNFTTMLVLLSFQSSSCSAIINKITRRTWHKIDATPDLIRIGSLGEENLILLPGLNIGDFKAKSRKGFRDFEKNLRMKRQNERIETWIRMADRSFRLEFVQV